MTPDQEIERILLEQQDIIRHMGYCVWYMGIVVGLMGIHFLARFINFCIKSHTITLKTKVKGLK